MVRKTVHYSGTVQGVNFRATARRIADGYDVGGYVKNLSDGRVELVANGSREQVDGFLNAVAERMGGLIRNTEVSEDSGAGDYGTFEIRR